MASFENESFCSINKQMMKLSKPKLVKLCKQYKVPPIGSKKEMSERLIQKQESKKKKKRLKSKRRKVEGRKNSKQIMPKNVKSNKKQSQSSLEHITPKKSSIQHKMQLKPYESMILTDALLLKGYKRKQQIVATLQGEVFIACKTSLHRDYLLIHGFIAQIMHNHIIRMRVEVICDICYLYYNYNQEVVIKSANKSLHYCNGKPIKTENENIIREAQLMSVFMEHNPPKSVIKYIDFFEDKTYYYLVLEKGGQGLFDFTIECHKRIAIGKLSINEWIKCVRMIFAKMVECISWLHSNARCCHLDISLENVVIAHDTYFDDKEGIIKNLDIRFIDFGVTQMFEMSNIGCVCDKYVGKTGYKAPEVYNEILFNAQKADIWSLGVCLFTLSIGAPPFNRPIVSDKRFEILKDGDLQQMLIAWNRWHYVEEEQFDLIIKMLCIEAIERLSIDEIEAHEWMKPFVKSNTINIVESGTVEYIDSDYFAAVNDNHDIKH